MISSKLLKIVLLLSAICILKRLGVRAPVAINVKPWSFLCSISMVIKRVDGHKFGVS